MTGLFGFASVDVRRRMKARVDELDRAVKEALRTKLRREGFAQ